jgi:O-methyltransferase
MGVNFFRKEMAKYNNKLNDLEWCFCGSRDSLDQVYDLALQVKDIPGDLVECGIASGSGIAAMKRACPDKMVWGFDSFQGIQLAGPNDTEQPGIGPITHDVHGDLLKSSGITVCSRDWVNGQLKGWGFKESDFTLVEGWVQNTLLEKKPDKIALLRLDMDIYDPTLFALEKLWHKLQKGGVLIIDDGNLEGVNRAVQDFFKSIGNPTVAWLSLPDSNPYYCIK